MLLILLAVFLIGSARLYSDETETKDAIRTIVVNIVEDNDGVWRVRDNNGQARGTIRAQSSDRVFWTTKNSAMVFFFPKNVNEYFELEEGMFEDGRSQRIEANEQLRLTIKTDAPTARLEYQVYVESAEKYVVGNSPPVLIINRE